MDRYWNKHNGERETESVGTSVMRAFLYLSNHYKKKKEITNYW